MDDDLEIDPIAPRHSSGGIDDHGLQRLRRGTRETNAQRALLMKTTDPRAPGFGVHFERDPGHGPVGRKRGHRFLR
jgi:hypothetical protein